MRGLVISNPTRISGSKIHISNSAIDRQELRSWLLFWDKLDFPRNNIISIGHTAEEEFLIQAGIMQRTEINVMALLKGTFDGGAGIVAAFREAFRRNDAANPGSWAMAHGTNSLSFDDNDLVGSRGLLIKLTSAIPVPNEDVGFDDLLSFKERRAAELAAIRDYIDEIYQSVLAAPDRPLAEHAAVERISRAAADHIKASRETKFDWRLFDLSARYNVTAAIYTGISTYFSTLSAGVALTAGAISGALINIGPSVGLKDKRGDNAFEYVSHYHRELFWQ